MELFYQYWGKAARPREDVSGDHYHLLVWHSLDVAACGYQMVQGNHFGAADILESLGFSRDDGARWLAWFLGAHDIGKFARGFQGLYQHNSPDLVTADQKNPYTCRHDVLGFWLWKALSAQWLEDDDDFLPACAENDAENFLDAMDIWMLASCGHHGMPPNTSKERSLLAFAKEDIAAAKTYLITLRTFFSFNAWPAAWKERTWRNKLKQQSWQLAGIITLADWLGSNITYFTYQSQPMPLAEYWPLALSRAQASVSALPLASPVSSYTGYQTLFPGIHKLTPLQHCTENLDVTPAGPQLAILEDVTGAGKTEAALILAHRLMSQGKGDGLYVGLPTMATANAMFERLAKAYHALYRHGSRPSLILAHGGSQMSEAFRQAVWQGSNTGQCQYGADEQGASAECNIWFTDSHKKALLAEVGIGTLDQLLMAVMPFRHQSLRLLGIRNKILILDEVHAYDGYILRLLEGLLLFHAAQGGSAIILSATLNTTLRTKLLAAFAAGADFPIPPPNFQAQYPWLSHLTASSLHETQLATREEVTRRVAIAWLDDIGSGIDRIHQIVARGECVCWIRNTVDEATAVYRQLIDAGKIPANDILLFHSRFAFIDRMAIENQVLTLFGKNSDPTQRRGKVLISTQVIEQSLDVDIDNMLSDLAPIDLLIQRAGRLQRHIRAATGELKNSLPDERPVPVLHVLAPEWQEEPDNAWPGGPLSGTRSVYRDHACLWRTQKILRELGEIRMRVPRASGDKPPVPGIHSQPDACSPRERG